MASPTLDLSRTANVRPDDIPASPARFRPDIQGLRAVAVLLVVLYHANVPGISGGYVGVDVFFVISGFLITGVLLREHTTHGRPSLLRFYASRARRILPLSSLTIGAVVIAGWLMLGAGRARNIASDGVWSALFASNIRFATIGTNYLGAQAAPSPLQHLWSLAVEEQFYLVWPLLVILTSRWAGRRFGRNLTVVLVALCAGSLAWSVYDTAASATWAYFSPFTRAWELGAGALLAVWGYRRTRPLPATAAAVLSWTGLALIVAAAVGYSASTAFPGAAALLPVVGAVLAIAGGTGARPTSASRLLSRPTFTSIGQLSYSWYLWHWPILIFAAARVGHPLTAAQGIAWAIVALGLSAVTYHLVENPVRCWEVIVRSTRRSLAVGAGAIAFTLATALIVGMVTQHRVSASSRARSAVAARLRSAPAATADQILADVAQGASTTALSVTTRALLASAADDKSSAEADGCQLTERQTQLPPLTHCWYGDPHGTQTVVLFGDSHAAMWLPAFEQIATWHHLRIYVLAKASCPAAAITLRNNVLGRSYQECTAWRQAALTRLGTLHPALTVVSSNGADGTLIDHGHDVHAGRDALWQAGLEQTLRQVAQASGRTVVLGDIPMLTASAPDCLATHTGNAKDCATPAGTAVPLAHDAAETAAATAVGAGYVNVTPWLCTSAVCPAVIGDLIPYYNPRHLSASYVSLVAGPLATALGL